MAGKMSAFSRELIDFLSVRLSSYGYETEVRKMFGHEVHFLYGYMFAGANERGISLPPKRKRGGTSSGAGP